MYGIFTYIYNENVGKYTIHGSYGLGHTNGFLGFTKHREKKLCQEASDKVHFGTDVTVEAW